MKIFNLETIRLRLLQNGTSRNLGARSIGAWSRSSLADGSKRGGRAGEMKCALQNNCSVNSLWATFAFLWPVHRVLGCSSLINKGI